MASVDPAGISPNLNFSFGKENTTSSAAEMEKGQIKDIVSFKKSYSQEKSIKGEEKEGQEMIMFSNIMLSIIYVPFPFYHSGYVHPNKVLEYC